MAEVTDLFGKPVELAGDVNQDLVDMLRRLLTDAEKGKIYSAGVVALRQPPPEKSPPSPDVDVLWVDACVLLQGGVERLAHMLNRAADNEAQQMSIRE